MDISKSLRESLGIRDNESRLYVYLTLDAGIDNAALDHLLHPILKVNYTAVYGETCETESPSFFLYCLLCFQR